jgi:DNA-binding transcriptional LysR family regulator
MILIDDRGLSDRTLRIFDVATREGTLSGAARKLGVGQPAVSHAVARLEAAVGTPVFSRSNRGVALTPVGRRLHEGIRGAFAEIDRAMSEAAGSIAAGSLTISVSTSFATYWLMPRLAEFKRQHPDIDLRVITSDSDHAVGRDDADLWIPLGSVSVAGLDERTLCAERIVPVAAPSLARRLQAGGPTPLRHAPLLHLEERYSPRFSWDDWFARHGGSRVSGDAGRDAYRSNDYSLVLHAALDGEGVALGWLHIVSDLVSAGRLVALGDPVETDEPFRILTRPTTVMRPAVALMQEWLCATMSGEASMQIDTNDRQ